MTQQIGTRPGQQPAAAPAPTGTAEEYRFRTLRTHMVVSDMWFPRSAPGPGDRVPSFDLPTLDGDRFRSDDLGERPVLMVFGSQTCPVTQSSLPGLRRLHRDFGDRIRFVLVNTREAHPGDVVVQPATDDEKRQHARDLRDQHDVRHEVAVDDLDGTLHRRMSPKPNSAYLLTPDGVITARVHWANDEQTLRAVLTDAVTGTRSRRRRRGAMVGPLLRAVGHLPGVVRRAGSKVERDVWRAAPPLALLGRASRLLPWLPEDRRAPALLGGIAGVAALVVGVLVVAGGL